MMVTHPDSGTAVAEALCRIGLRELVATKQRAAALMPNIAAGCALTEAEANFAAGDTIEAAAEDLEIARHFFAGVGLELDAEIERERERFRRVLIGFATAPQAVTRH